MHHILIPSAVLMGCSITGCWCCWCNGCNTYTHRLAWYAGGSSHHATQQQWITHTHTQYILTVELLRVLSRCCVVGVTAQHVVDAVVVVAAAHHTAARCVHHVLSTPSSLCIYLLMWYVVAACVDVGVVGTQHRSTVHALHHHQSA